MEGELAIRVVAHRQSCCPEFEMNADVLVAISEHLELIVGLVLLDLEMLQVEQLCVFLDHYVSTKIRPNTASFRAN
jgi:hypothetical protein